MRKRGSTGVTAGRNSGSSCCSLESLSPDEMSHLAAAAAAGDWVDRGTQGFEVVMTLWAFKLAHPASVFLNRGNHEDEDMNTVYFFQDEVSHVCRCHAHSLVFCR